MAPSPQSKHYSLEITVTVRGDDTINIGGLTQDHSTIVAVCPKNNPYCALPVLVLVLQMAAECFQWRKDNTKRHHVKCNISLVNITEFWLQKDTRPKNILLMYWHLANISHLYLSVPVVL